MTYPIGIDTRMLQNTGIGTYLKGLLRGLENSHFPKNQIHLFGEQLAEGSSFERTSFGSKIYSISEQAEYPFRLKIALFGTPHITMSRF